MTDFNSDDGIKRMLKEAYQPAAPSSEFKEQMRKRLAHEARSAGIDVPQPVLARPKLVVPIISAIAAGLIGYGVWLSLNLVPNLIS
jgi:hypothetical protein